MFLKCFYVVCAVLMSRFCCCYNKNVQNYKYGAFLMCTDSISSTERVFVAV